MSKFRRHLLVIASICLVLTGCEPNNVQPSPTNTDNQAIVKNVVVSFGKVLKNVSLLAPKEIFVQDIQTNYGNFLTPELLVAWKNDPTTALGKTTSSPWPDHIDVSKVTEVTATQYTVQGNIIEMTSNEVEHGGNAGEEAIDLIVQQVANQWLISKVTRHDTPNAGLKTYDQNGIFLQYADKFTGQTGNNMGGANLDTSLIKVSIPKEMVTSANTNFNEAYLVVSKSTAPKTVSTCTAFTETNHTTDTFTTVTINGIIFTASNASDAGAGNLYTSKLYRTVHKNTCYELALVVHTSNIHNYDPPVTEFNQNEAIALLSPVLNSFRFQD